MRIYCRRSGFAAVGLMIAALTVRGAPNEESARYTTWSAFGGSVDSMQYSALRQINKTNVATLELVWSYAAPGEGGPGRFSFSPLVVDDVMYVGGKDNAAVVALDAATGRTLWSFVTESRRNRRPSRG